MHGVGGSFYPLVIIVIVVLIVVIVVMGAGISLTHHEPMAFA